MGVKHPGFARYYLGTLLHPARTFAALRKDPRRLRHGSLAMLITASLYTAVYVFLAMGGGAPSSFAPWLAVPLDAYYSYNRFWLAPSMFGCWILAAGVGQLLSRWAGGKGSFEDMLSILGFAIAVATLGSLLHDLPDSFLGAVGLLDLRAYEVALNTPTVWRAILWTCYGSSAVLFLVLFPKAVGAAQELRKLPSAGIGVTVFLVYQGVFLIFNR